MNQRKLQWNLPEHLLFPLTMEFLRKKNYQKMAKENLRKIVRLLCRENQLDLGTLSFP